MTLCWLGTLFPIFPHWFSCTHLPGSHLGFHLHRCLLPVFLVPASHVAPGSLALRPWKQTNHSLSVLYHDNFHNFLCMRFYHIETHLKKVFLGQCPVAASFGVGRNHTAHSHSVRRPGDLRSHRADRDGTDSGSRRPSLCWHFVTTASCSLCWRPWRAPGGRRRTGTWSDRAGVYSRAPGASSEAMAWPTPGAAGLCLSWRWPEWSRCLWPGLPVPGERFFNSSSEGHPPLGR